MKVKNKRYLFWNKLAITIGLMFFTLLLLFNIVAIFITLNRMSFSEFIKGAEAVVAPSSTIDYVAKPTKTVSVLASSYSSTIDQTDSTPCITANGYNVCSYYEVDGFGETIAANFLPMGTVVKIPELYGDKFLVVRDRMNPRYGYGRIDIWMPTRSEALIFGKRWIDVEIFE
ncbi:3D domain-containing protein [Patescibacteria group bacterium]|nr:3D domain-containing protein [Patescibacteria group bacterium]